MIFVHFRFLNYQKGTMRKALLLILSFTCFIQINSQEVRVLTTKGEPIENVSIFNPSMKISTLTNEQGRASIARFTASDTLVFQHPTYKRISLAKKRVRLMDYTVILKRQTILMEEFVISVSRSRESKKDIPNMIDIIQPSELNHSTALNSADLLTSTGNIVVQKSQGGGGSPILRGFEANKILLVIDGVRMNNAIYRGGHLQNALTIDNQILERAEILYGPASVMYGSDALGGVVHYYTKDPEFSVDGPFNFQTNAFTQYASATNSTTGHLDLNLGSREFASLSSFTYSDFGNITMGKNRSPFLPDFGKDFHYAARLHGMDTVLANSNPHVQKETGYEQYDFLQKFRYRPANFIDMMLNLQYSTSSKIHRYDKLNDYKDHHLKYAEWYYGPQNRFMAALQTKYLNSTPLFTNFNTIVSFQRIDEDRITRGFGDELKYWQMEEVDVYTLTTDFLKIRDNGDKINYGIEMNYNIVNSEAHSKNIVTGGNFTEMSRYPDEGSITQTYSAYMGYKKVFKRKLIVNSGIRYSYNHLYSGFSNELLVLPFDEIEISNGAVTGSLSFVYHPTEDWKLNLIGSTGFRNPNVDDYGKVRAKDDYVTVPSPDIGPEYAYNLEFGLSRTFEGYIKIGATGFMTYLTDAIVRQPHSIMGKDSLEFQGHQYKMIANTNADRAMINGLSFNILADVSKNIRFKSILNFIEGTNLTHDVPMAHIPPMFGNTMIKYTTKRTFFQFDVRYNGWKEPGDMSPYGEDNEEEATPHGYPAWYTLNAKAAYNLGDNMFIQLAIDNILDYYYKTFASGISAPGRSFVISLKYSI